MNSVEYVENSDEKKEKELYYIVTGKIKLNLDNMSSNVEPIDKNDNKCFTEINNNNNKNSKKNINQNEENQTLQNGGTIVATIYDENPTLVPIKSYKDKIGVRHNYSMDFEESEEPNLILFFLCLFLMILNYLNHDFLLSYN